MRPIHALLLAVLTGAAPGGRTAEACGNAIIFATDDNVRAVKAAEDKLNDGSPAEAGMRIQALDKGYFKLSRTARVNLHTDDKAMLLANRALRVFALATVRLDGTLGPFGNAKPAQREQNIRWAIALLQQLTIAKPNDAAARTDHAEALARTDPAAAKTTLEELAAKDVLTTAYAYATLASLRAAAGDDAGRDAALAKCTTMAAKPAICALPKPTR